MQKPPLPLGLKSVELGLYGSTPKLLYPAKPQLVQPPHPFGNTAHRDVWQHALTGLGSQQDSTEQDRYHYSQQGHVLSTQVFSMSYHRTVIRL